MTQATTTDDDETRSPEGRVRLLGWVLGLAMVGPPIVAIAVLAGRTWQPFGDLATIDLQVRDVLSAHPPLTGLYSRRGWNHPGPALPFLIAPISAVFNQAPWATHIGGAVLEAGAMAWLAVVTWRHRLSTMVAAAAVVGMTYLAIGPWVVRQPWNLHVPLIWLVLVLFLAVLVASGSLRHVIGLTIAATVTAQTHIGFVPLVVAAVGFALGCLALEVRRTRVAPERWRSTATISIGLVVVLWLPPILDIVLHWPGNLGRAAKYFAGGGSHVGFSRAAGIVATEFRIVPPWLSGVDPSRDFVPLFAEAANTLWLLVPVALLGLGTLAAWRSQDRDDRRRIVLAGLLLFVAVSAISRADLPISYTFQWRVVVASFIVVVSVQAIATFVGRSRPALRTAGAATACALAVWGSVDLSAGVVSQARDGPIERQSVELAQILPTIRSAAHDGERSRVVLVRPVGGIGIAGLVNGVINEFDRAGADVLVDARYGRFFGTHRVGRAAGADTVWYVSGSGSDRAAMLRIPGGRVVASTSPLSRGDEAELRQIQAVLGRRLVRAGLDRLTDQLDSPLLVYALRKVPEVDPRLAARASLLNERVARSGRCRCTIVEVSAALRTAQARVIESARFTWSGVVS